MDILLVHPPKRDQVWAGVPDIFNKQDSYIFPPLGIMYLSSYLHRNTSHRVDVIDCLPGDLDAEDVVRKVRQVRPRVMGIIACTHNLINVHRIILAVKMADASIRIVLGGPHVTSFPREAAMLEGVDVAVQGDGEEPLRALLDAWEAGLDPQTVPGTVLARNGAVTLNPLEHQAMDLDVFPFPDRESFPLDGYYTPGMVARRATTIISSRGCPNRCVFCNVPQCYRTRSVGNIVDEMQECVERYGIEEIHFIDDIFNPTPDRVIAVADEIIRRRLKISWGFKASCAGTTYDMLRRAKEAGLVRMHYGVETYSDEGLRELNKHITIEQIFRVFRWTQELRIRNIAYMIIGNPHEQTEQSVLAVKGFIRRLNPDFVVYSLFTPYPDAPIFQRGVELGLWDEDCWKRFMLAPKTDYELPTAWTRYLDKPALLRLFKNVNRSFYFHPRVLARTMCSLRGFEDFKRTVRGGLSLVKMEFLRAGARRI
ncbi:B12-binding domain-containing radical SAM protein [bacterium]|nr:B12-binding domain-containing radical SAM protein [candidate division CSSED10-310 bacterium]